MTAFVLTWNPGLYAWQDRSNVIARVHRGEQVRSDWSTGVRTGGMDSGDEVWLLRQGDEPRGLVARGRATSTIYQGQHWSGEPGQTANYVDLVWDDVREDAEVLPLGHLRDLDHGFNWDLRSGGVLLPDDLAALVADAWGEDLSGTPRRAWLMMAVGDRRQFAGNDGYEDDIATTYRWDSTVNNHAQVGAGDLVVLWDKKASLGVSVVEGVTTGHERKSLRRCPHCEKASIKKRATRSPAYRCQECGATFDSPRTTQQEVTTYASQHDIAWIDLPGTLDKSQLRALCRSPQSQLSIRPMRVRDTLEALRQALPGHLLGTVTTSTRRLQCGHDWRTVRARRGQAAFRAALLAQHGHACAMTGPAPEAALEAAHLYSYARQGHHEQDGGLLLRRDLHRLFDLGLLAVDPVSGLVDVHASLRPYPEYDRLHGIALQVRLTGRQKQWIAAHWAQHRLSSA